MKRPQRYEYYFECAFFTNQSRVYYLDHLFYSALKSKPRGILSFFSNMKKTNSKASKKGIDLAGILLGCMGFPYRWRSVCMDAQQHPHAQL